MANEPFFIPPKPIQFYNGLVLGIISNGQDVRLIQCTNSCVAIIYGDTRHIITVPPYRYHYHDDDYITALCNPGLVDDGDIFAIVHYNKSSHIVMCDYMVDTKLKNCGLHKAINYAKEMWASAKYPNQVSGYDDYLNSITFSESMDFDIGTLQRVFMMYGFNMFESELFDPDGRLLFKAFYGACLDANNGNTKSKMPPSADFIKQTYDKVIARYVEA